jgi:hypothetical protein
MFNEITTLKTMDGLVKAIPGKILSLVLTLIAFVINDQGVSAQIRSDFILAEEGAAPSLKIDKNGNIQAVWRFDGIYYGVFDSLFSTLAFPKRISNSEFTNSPRVTLQNDFGVAVWQIRPLIGFNSFIWGQLFRISGDTMFNNIQFNDNFRDAGRFAPDAAFLNDTTFIVVWAGNGTETGSATGIYGQIVTTSLDAVGPDRLLSDVHDSEILHGSSRVAKNLSNGDFVIVWRDNRFGANKVFGRLFLSDGTPKASSFVISEDPNLTDLWFLSIDTDGEENFAVAWGGEKDPQWYVQLRRFNNDGMPLGSSVQVNSNLDSVIDFASVDLSFDCDGKLIVVWEQEENGRSKIFAQRFLADGTPLGENFRVSMIEDTLDQFFPDVELHNEKIYTLWGSEGAIWANILDYNNPPTPVENKQSDLPNLFQLYQNYPNPFNPTTTIRYEVSQSSEVKLVVYNILGKEIITLVNQEVMPGIHQVQWNGKDFKGGDVPTGVYLYRLSFHDYAKVKKMILVK